MKYLLLLLGAALVTSPAMAEDLKPSAAVPAQVATEAISAESTNTDFLSDDEWRRLPREQRRLRSRASNIARYEPSGKPDINRLDQYIAKYKDIVVYDSRLAHVEVKGKPVQGTTGSIELSGEVSVPQLKSGIESTIRQLGFDVVRNDVQVLPSAELGTEIYAHATTTAATLRKEPRVNSEQVNSVPMGGWVRLLRHSRPEDVTNAPGRGSRGPVEVPGPDVKWFLAQSPEGYLGYVRSDQLKRSQDYKLPEGMIAQPTSVTVEGKSILAPAGTYVTGSNGDYNIPGLGAKLPNGAKVVALAKPTYTEQEILEVAAPLMNTRYEWGGVTDKGIDCSGFTQYLFKYRGIFLPRDAEEQAIVGQIVAFGRDAEKKAQPGDVLFFVGENGKINHVGLSLGDGRLIHSSGPGVHITTLQKESDDESGRSLLDRIIFARRVLSR